MLIFLLACHDGGESSSTPEGKDTGTPVDSDTPVDSADSAPVDTGDSTPVDTQDSGGVEEIEATWVTSPNISTVGTVTWTTPEAAGAWVEFGPDETYGRMTRVDETMRTDHTIVVAGIPADVTWHWRAVSKADSGATYESADATITTGPAGPMPSLTVTTTSDERTDGYIVTALLNLDESVSLVILDQDGNPVWWRTSESNKSLSRARLSSDGQYVTYDSCVATDDSLESECTINRVSLDQTELTQTPAAEISHDFVETDSGGYLYIAKDIRKWTDPSDGVEKQVAGDDVVATSPDGTRTVLWSAWDTLDVDLDHEENWDGESWDWTHCNSIQRLESMEAVLISCKLINSAFFLSPDGSILHSFGGDTADLTLTSGTGPDGQHYAYYEGDDHAGTLSLFDNRITTQNARLVSYAVNFDDSVASEAWDYEPDPPVDVDGRGSFVRLPNGNLLASWGSANLINQLTPEGDVVWQLETGEHGTVSYTEWAQALGGAPSTEE